MSNEMKLISIICLFVLLVSCDPESYNAVKISVINETDNKILILCEVPFGQFNQESKYDSVSQDRKNVILSTYTEYSGTGGASYKLNKIWFYNPSDSTYIICTNYENTYFTGTNVNINEKEKVIFVDNIVVTRLDNGKRLSQKYSTDFTYIINDSLLSKMTKNTALTDSIFNLKK